MDKLHFNPGNLNLLDHLPIPASIFVNGRTRASNRAMEKQAGLHAGILINQEPHLSPGNADLRIKIRDKEVRAGIIHSDNNEYVLIGITYNEAPGSMVISGPEDCGPTLSESLRHMESSKGIEKILLVDDNLSIVETYQSILSILGYETFQFTSPFTALNSMENEHFDLLISDYDMPGMNGLELLRSFYSRRPGFPVIIISGFAGFPGAMFRSEFRDQMISFMNKPVTLKELGRSLEVVDFFYRLSRLKLE